MSGRAHRQDIHATPAAKGGVKTFSDTSPDGERVDYHGMQARAAAESRARGDAGPGAGEPWDESSRGKFDVDGTKGAPGARAGSGMEFSRSGPAPESGSDILPYQKPIAMQRRGRRTLSRDSDS